MDASFTHNKVDSSTGQPYYTCGYKNTVGCIQKDSGFEDCGSQALEHFSEVYHSPYIREIPKREWERISAGLEFPRQDHLCYQYFLERNSKEAYIRALGTTPLGLSCRVAGCAAYKELPDDFLGGRSNNDMKPYVDCLTVIDERPGGQRLLRYKVSFWYRERCLPMPGAKIGKN